MHTRSVLNLNNIAGASRVLSGGTKLLGYLVLPGRLLHEEREDSEAQRLRGSTGLLVLLES